MDTTARPALPRLLTSLLIWLALFGVLAGIHAAADIMGPLFIALNLLIAAWPVRTILIRRGSPPLLATIALGLVVFTVLGLAMFSLGLAVSALVRELPEYQAQFLSMYNQLVSFASSLGITQDQVLAEAKKISPASMASFVSSALSGLSGAVTLGIVLVLMLFLLIMDADTVERRSRGLASFRPEMSMAIGDFVLGVRRYWVVTTVFGLIVAVLDTALLLIMGVPLALVWGLVAFLTNYIPNVGFVIGVIPPALMALLAISPAASLVVIVAYSVINFVIQSLIQPKFNGDAVGVTALVSFLSLLVWSMVLGPIGALMGLPATLLLKTLLIDHDPSVRWFNAFLASDPADADPGGAGLPEEPRSKAAATVAGGSARPESAAGPETAEASDVETEGA